MYNIIWYFQIICILVTLGCLYLTSQNAILRQTVCRDTWLITIAGVFVAECGYGLYLQALTLEGLMIARKVYLIACVIALSAWVVTWASQSLVCTIFALSASVFIASDKLDNFLFRGMELQQNQYFYYIEETKQSLYYVGKGMFSLLLATVFVWILLKKGDTVLYKGKAKVLFAVATVLPCFVLVVGEWDIFRHYPLMAPALTASVVLAQAGLHILGREQNIQIEH